MTPKICRLPFILTVFALIFFTSIIAQAVGPETGQAADSGFHREIRYQEYLARHQNAARPQAEYIIPGADFTATDMRVEIVKEHGGRAGRFLQTGERGYVEWELEVEEAGLYNIAISYFPISGRGSTIEREIWINGKRPFAGAGHLSFFRVWADEGPSRLDNQGNELRPKQIEKPCWQEVVLRDSRGYEQEAYLFYLRAGKNTIRLLSRKEPMLIGRLKVFQIEEPPAYRELSRKYEDLGYRPVANAVVKIQGETARLRSNPTLFPIFDKGDPTVEPYHPVAIRLNTIGGSRWDRAGQWITWEFEVPETGLYKIAIKGKQNIRRGVYSSRRIFIDGRVPFKELEAVRFPYSNYYQMYVLGGQEEPYLFYLEKGKHKLTLQVTLGELADLIRVAEQSLYELNTIYRRIIMITSSTPDPLRDYQLGERIPHILERMRRQSEIIGKLARSLEEATGQKGGHVVTLNYLARLLKAMADEPDTIARRLSEYRDNVGALGAWTLQTAEQPLQIDYILVAAPDEKLPRAEPTFAELLMHEIRAFVASFTYDYDRIGDVDAPGRADREPLTVWIGTGLNSTQPWISAGRDQAESLKRMIEDSFTPKTGIPVKLEMVNSAVLLPATLAGKGPDVALVVDPSQPMNFGVRSAAIDLSQFPDFPEVAKRFKPSALEPFTFRGKVYALPEQQLFPMLFYRKDILEELGLEIPQTWEDVVRLIPELQKDHMNFGLPFSSIPRVGSTNLGEVPPGAGSLSSSLGVTTFLMFLNQKGERLFKPDAYATNLNTSAAIEAFMFWTDLYELYNLPLDYNAENRFRLGEMPLLVAPYPLYNMLMVFAPELRGQWEFATIPGTCRSDGTIDRSVPATGPACMILSGASDKQAAWEFLKWWTSTEIQVRYGRELESVIGPAARYPTANVEALQLLPWPVEDLEKLLAQWDWVTGVPEVPGGYMVGRHLDNAFRRVVYQQEPARETLLDYNRLMNEEIQSKRKELGIQPLSDQEAVAN